ncbi:hypothetical protein Y032_0342g3021 [Ancylostoma ceylanicum]|uniref:Uncharacterized protein n=1 Tax=Ancylostoma ceylanicum TaxID=53326 RepID=A0A016RXV5_9BILA|nr:hypothetical protein Y032_0342g3021 [Ancylostoma ceylanicum]
MHRHNSQVCFCAGERSLFVLVSHLCCAESVLHYPHISSKSRVSTGAASKRLPMSHVEEDAQYSKVTNVLK